ncbi:MAG: UMP kinase [Elusimicrobiota bacterium]
MGTASNLSRYKRILIKLSGESLAVNGQSGLSADVVDKLAHQLKKVQALPTQISIVIGGGNIWRGVFGENMDRVTSDYMGMLATMINALALQNALESIGVPTRVQSAINMQKLAEPFIRRRAIRHLEKGRIVIFACGTGNPFFTTDTAAVLRASEVEAEVILKATKVDGVYSDDPVKNKDAKRYTDLSFQEALVENLRIMDATAFSLCREKNIPVIVFDMTKNNNIVDVVCGKNVGTLIHN